MKYNIQNTSAARLWVSGPFGKGNVCIEPLSTAIVPETSKDSLVLAYPDKIVVLGTAQDDEAPVQKKVTTPATWTLVDMGRECGFLKFLPSTTGIQVSFSGWNSPASAPPASTVIDIPTASATPGDEFLTIDMQSNLTQQVYVKGTAGTEQLTIIGY